MDDVPTNSAKVLTWSVVAVMACALAAAAFALGMWVGETRAGFSFRWADEYHRNFGGPGKGVFGNFPGEDFINPHGVFGSVISAGADVLMVKGQDNMEKSVAVSAHTTIMGPSGSLKFSDIKIGDNVVIIGAPNAQGQIDARFIRIFPQGVFLMRWAPDTCETHYNGQI